MMNRSTNITLCFIIALAIALTSGSCVGPKKTIQLPSVSLKVGDQVPEFTLDSIDGIGMSLHFLSPDSTGNIITPSAYVFAWTGIGCPMAQVYSPRLNDLYNKFKSQGVEFFQIHSNIQDNLDEIKAELKERPVSFGVVQDLKGRLARAFNVTRTTEVLVIDRFGKLRYKGAIDDQYGFKTNDNGTRSSYRKFKAENNYLENALSAILKAEPLAQTQTEAFGCALGFEWETDQQKLTEEDANPKVTFHKDIQPLLQKHCQKCHRENGIGPFPLVDYKDIKGWADTIEEVVTDRLMPPWHADPKFGHFRNDSSLTENQIQLVQEWVKSGAPKGNNKDAPPPIKWEDGWTIGEPDIVYTTESYKVPKEGRVPYRYVSVQTNFKEDKWVQAAQFISTAPQVVHHVLTFVKPPYTPHPGAGKRFWRPRFNPISLLQGAKRSEYGKWMRRNRKNAKHMFVGNAGGLDGYFLGAMAGDSSQVYPEGQAKLLPAGGTLWFQIHYTPNGKEHESITQLALKFADGPPEEAVESHGTSTVVIEIPPNEPAHKIETEFKFPRNAKMLALGPHMHLRGKEFTFVAEYPNGEKETLLHVPNYDFDWQIGYIFKEPKDIPKGTKLKATAIFDNSKNNPNNPDPGQTVYFGLQSDDEMMIGYFEVIWEQTI